MDSWNKHKWKVICVLLAAVSFVGLKFIVMRTDTKEDDNVPEIVATAILNLADN